MNVVQSLIYMKNKTNIKYRGSSWRDECGAIVVIVVQLADICLCFRLSKWGQCGAIVVKILF